MSVHQSSTLPSASATPLPTGTATNHDTANSSKPAPRTHSRPIGEHAKSLGFDWAKRADQHRYRRELDLPDIHAAIINNDWDTAIELVCPEDLGLLWYPPASHHSSPTWTNTLFSKNASQQQSAIIGMALDKVSTTTVGKDVVAYGANLLTLSLLIPCPKTFRDKVFQMAVEHHSPYLHLADGSGRTPLWVAIDREDVDAVKFLLENGVSPLSVSCLASGMKSAPLEWAAAKGNNEIFALCLEKSIGEFEASPYYSVKLDFLQLQRWAKNKDEADIRWLAKRVPQLKNILFSLPNGTGTSILHRHLIEDRRTDNSLPEKIDENCKNIFAVNPLIGTDPRLGPSIAPLMIAARKVNWITFISLLDKARPYVNAMSPDKSLWFAWGRITQHCIIQYINYRSTEDLVSLIVCDPIMIRTTPFFKATADKLQKSDFEQYQTILKALVPALTDEQKLIVFEQSANKDDGRTEFVLSKLDCSLTEKTLANMMDIAARHGNRTAFEFACERSLTVGKVLDELKEAPQHHAIAANTLAIKAIDVRSTQWLHRLIQSGLDLNPIIRMRAEFCLPMLSDLDPNHLPAWLDSFESFLKNIWSFRPAHVPAPPPVEITDQMIARATTEPGEQALRKLQQKNSSAQ